MFIMGNVCFCYVNFKVYRLRHGRCYRSIMQSVLSSGSSVAGKINLSLKTVAFMYFLFSVL